MNEATIKAVSDELGQRLVGSKFGKVFALERETLVCDFRGGSGAYLLVRTMPSDPRIHITERTLRNLEKESLSGGVFVALLRKHLSHAVLSAVNKIQGERIVAMEFVSRDEVGIASNYILEIRLTGRSSDVVLKNEEGETITSFMNRVSQNDGPQPAPIQNSLEKAFDSDGFPTVSAALDSFYSKKDSEALLLGRIANVRRKVAAKRKKLDKLRAHLEQDLERHGDPEHWKRLGDLVNANIQTAVREGETVFLTDYFDESLPVVELVIEKNLTLPEAAEKYFSRYSKAKTGIAAITSRLEETRKQIEQCDKEIEEIENSEAEDIDLPPIMLGGEKSIDKKGRRRISDESKHARRFETSDGYQILVGKKSKDNDYLTFRIARSLDIWLHAADYPGSHVVIRRKGKEEVPQNIIEIAARLAAFYSKAKNEGKAAVRFAQRKFVSKPKGAAPGLVSISTSKTIMVNPGIDESLKKAE
ncbi:MAG: NFACT RNA binding domain-containing protein [Pyrinomonadaceae bacterium]